MGAKRLSKFGENGQRFPIAASFELGEALAVEPAFADPTAQIVGGDRAVLLLIAADDFVHSALRLRSEPRKSGKGQVAKDSKNDQHRKTNPEPSRTHGQWHWPMLHSGYGEAYGEPR